MFGYIGPDRPYLFIKDETLYKAMYCGVCRCISKECGQMARTALTYDMAFMSALSTFVAQNMGAGQPERARKSLLIARRISVVFGAGIFLLTFFGGGLLAAIFENDPAVIAATAAYLRGSSLEYLLTPAIFCTLGYIASASCLSVVARSLRTALRMVFA